MNINIDLGSFNFKEFLRRTAKGFENIIFAFGAATLLDIFLVLGMKYYRLIPHWVVLFGRPDADAPSWVYPCIGAPLAEELLFRVLPIELVRQPLKYYKRLDIFDKFKYYYIGISAALFGCLLHWGYWSIWMQGVDGFLFGYVYLKNKWGYPSSVLLHGLMNAVACYLVPTVQNL